jgi:hypothetical protein
MASTWYVRCLLTSTPTSFFLLCFLSFKNFRHIAGKIGIDNLHFLFPSFPFQTSCAPAAWQDQSTALGLTDVIYRTAPEEGKRGTPKTQQINKSIRKSYHQEDAGPHAKMT